MSRNVKLATAALAASLPLLSLPAPLSHAALDTSRSFWLGIPAGLESKGNSLAIVANAPATFEVSSAEGDFSETGSVGPNSPASVALPDSLAISGSETVGSKGVHVTASAPVGVTFFNDDAEGGSSGATLIEPESALGKNYRAVAYQETGTGPSQLTIVGTRSETSIVVTPTCNGAGGAPAGTPIDLDLGAGQSWQYECNSGGNTSGSTIVADKPVAAFAGNRCAKIPPGEYCDFLVEQMIPTNRWGTKFFLPPLDDTTDDHVVLVANADNTSITSSGLVGAPTEMDAGQSIEATMSGDARISADKRIFVAQYAAGPLCCSAEGDPLALGVQPFSEATKVHRFVTPSGYATDLVNVVAPNGTEVKLDGTVIEGFDSLPGDTHKWATVAVEPGQHLIRADAKVIVYAYGMRLAAAYGYVASSADRLRTSTTVTVDKTSSDLRASGRVTQLTEGKVTVKLFRKQGGDWKLLDSKKPELTSQGKYSTKFPRPDSGDCMATTRFAGDKNYSPSSDKLTFNC